VAAKSKTKHPSHQPFLLNGHFTFIFPYNLNDN
jgi:hypothetical protein